MIPENSLEGASLDSYLLRDGFVRGAVVICPGGGYSLVADREAAPVARAFNRAGFHSFVLRYSVGHGPLGNLPLRQLGAAVASVREHAVELQIDSRQVSVCGFSAGGHLAASLGVFWHDVAIFGSDGRLEARRPDSLVLCYPVITSGEAAHRASFERLAGLDHSVQESFSVERFVSESTPPTFLWHTAEDVAVPVRNSLLFFSALRECGVPSELHIFPTGPHGLSMATPDVAEPENSRFANHRAAAWFALAVEWLASLPALQSSSAENSPSTSSAPTGAAKG